MPHVIRFLPFPLGCALLALPVILNPGAHRVLSDVDPPEWTGGVIWDDFNYASSSELTSRMPWCVADPENIPESSTGCRVERYNAWYETNWRENTSGPAAGIMSVGRATRSQLRLAMIDGETYEWGKNPIVVSGFAHRTGTWYARVRLHDFSEWSPGTTSSFWTQSPYWACADVTPGASCMEQNEKYWSEWNFEWTSYWIADRRSSPPWMSTGAVADGEASAIGGSPLRGAVDAPDFSCHDPTGGILTWNACRSYFINAKETSDVDGPYVDLMMRFDGRNVFWEAVAHANAAPLPHPWVRATATSPEIGPGQPVLTFFSMRSRMGDLLSHDRWYLADWFLFTPETDKTLAQMAEASQWLRESGKYDRLNTTGVVLSRPTTSTGLRLETVDDGLSRGEFLAIPPLNLITYYAVHWSFRATNRVDRSGNPRFRSGWVDLDDHSFRVEIPEVRRFRYSEVKVRYRLHADPYGRHVGPVPIRDTDERCAATNDNGASFSACSR